MKKPAIDKNVMVAAAILMVDYDNNITKGSPKQDEYHTPMSVVEIEEGDEDSIVALPSITTKGDIDLHPEITRKGSTMGSEMDIGDV